MKQIIARLVAIIANSNRPTRVNHVVRTHRSLLDLSGRICDAILNGEIDPKLGIKLKYQLDTSIDAALKSILFPA
jgi:hypothetical protein